MATGIGRSTDKSTAANRIDLPVTSEPASVRYNNPGAQYPSERAARFGQVGYGIIGGGHKIARFPDPVNGAAANFDLLFRNYAGMRMGPAGKKWTGSYGFGIPGYPDDTILTKEMVNEAKLAIAIMKAIAGREAGKSNTLTEEQWKQAHEMFRAGSADAFLNGTPPDHEAGEGAATGPTGAGLLRRARKHIGEKYVNVQVPKDEPSWTGPWDCAEFVSWLVYQEAKTLYGCVDDNEKPSQADAYTGAWEIDVKRKGIRVSVKEAASTVGGILLRYPPSAGAMGHIVLCDGAGGTVEAMGRKYGVVASTVHGRRWDTGVLIPGISYDGDDGVDPWPPEVVYRRNEPNMDSGVIRRLQEALVLKNFLDRSEVDGEFGRSTEDAVIAFQKSEGLVVDGEVGPDTAGALNITLKPGDKPDEKPVEKGPDAVTPPPQAGDPLLGIAISLLPTIAKFLVGDKAGAITDLVKKLVTDTAGTSNPDQAKKVLQDDQAARTALQLKLAEIEKDQIAESEKRRLELLKEQNAAEAEKRKVELEEVKARIEDTQGARSVFASLALAKNPMAWGAPIVSFIVTIGFFTILTILIFRSKQKIDDSILQLINIIVGALAAGFATVISFWLGSSQGSRIKDAANIEVQERQARDTKAIIDKNTEQTTRIMEKNAQQAEARDRAFERTIETVVDSKSTGAAAKSTNAIDRCFDIVAKFEADEDPSGDTRFGISVEELRSIRNLNELTMEDLKKLTPEAAREIYRVRYWNPLNCDKLPAGVDLVVFDFGVASGLTVSAERLQRVVGAEADGAIGPATLGATKAMAAVDVVTKLSKLRLEYDRDKSSLDALRSRRITTVENEALVMARAGNTAAPV